jgi:hypothetical protein
MNLFQLQCSATAYGQPPPGGDWWGTPGTPVASASLRALRQWVGADGNLWVAEPDNAALDLNLSAPGVQHYGAWATPTKYKSYFTVYVNQPDPGGNSLFNTNNPSDWGHAWWGLTTEAHTAAINQLIPANLISILSKTTAGYHFTGSLGLDGTAPGILNIVAGKYVSGYGAEGLYQVGLLDGEGGLGIVETADSQSLVRGRFGITQLLQRNCSTPGFSTSGWELDASIPYDTGDHKANVVYNSSGSAEAQLGDAPFVIDAGLVWSQDQFEDYFMFRPTDASGNPLPGSIWTTLGTSDWNWFGAVLWCTSCSDGWVFDEDPQFYCSQSITPSHQHPEFQNTYIIH